MMQFIINTIKLIRVKHWIKNLFVFFGLVFSLNLFNPKPLIISVICFFAFCFASSFVYIINDIIDKEKDIKHPDKKNRIIASGQISVFTAVILSLFFLLLSVTFALNININTLIIIIIYILINILYSLFLKHIVILDVMIIAMGFVLRVLAGTVSIGIDASNWILLTTLSISLFLGFGKRRNEIIVMGKDEYLHRPVLEHYNMKLLDYMIIVSITMTVITYILYTIDPETINKFNTANLVYTVPLVIFGLFRYMYILFKKESGGDPAEIVLKDKYIVFSVIGWLILIVLLIYKVF